VYVVIVFLDINVVFITKGMGFGLLLPNKMEEMKATFRKIVMSVALGLSTLGTAYAGTDGKVNRCESTSDLSIANAKVDLDRGGDSELRGKIINDSEKNDYRNVRIRVNFIDDDGDRIGYATIPTETRVGDESSETFVAKFRAPEDTKNVTYEVECAEAE
jgi:hypothetical protein